MKLIAAVDKNWAIGFDGKLLFNIPEDLKNFKKLTYGKAVVIGRKTLESLPGGRPLNGRTNIVITSDPFYECEDAIIADSIEKALDIIESPTFALDSDDVYIIGGGSIYEQFLPYCDSAYITKVDYKALITDTFCPNLDIKDEWIEESHSDIHSHFGINYQFVTYKKK